MMRARTLECREAYHTSTSRSPSGANTLLSAICTRRRRAASAAGGARAERNEQVELVRGGGGRGRAPGIA
jgi:hypothetical protein